MMTMTTLLLPAKLESLEPFRTFVLQEVESFGMAQDRVLQIELVLEELLVNIVSYAYPQGGGEVEVGCSIEEGEFHICIRDWGVPFDPLTKEEPNLAESISDRRVGGLGIFLVREMTSQVSYQRQGDSNLLRLCFEASSPLE